MINFFIFLIVLYLTSTFSFASSKYYGEIADIKGSVWLIEDTQLIPLENGMPVRPNDKIKTGKNSSCNIELDDGTFIFVGEKTEFTVESVEITEEKNESKISLWLGKLLASISRRRKTKFNIHTPVSVIAVRGTEFAVEADETKTNVGVFDGEVAVSSIDLPEEVAVKADEETSVLKNGKPSRPVKLQAIMQKNKEKMQKLKGRIQELRERLKRLPPEQRYEARRRALERFQSLKEKRLKQLQKIKEKHENIKQNIRKRK